MCVKAIYHALRTILRIYHGGEIIFERTPIVFQKIEDGKLIILGAYSLNDSPDGLYLDCTAEPDPDEPDIPDNPVGEWIYPIQNGNVLTIEQVYKATQNGNVLEVE